MTDIVYLEEVRGEAEEAYLERWLTEPPDIGVAYRVLEDEWLDDEGNPADLSTSSFVRVIRRVEVV